MNQPNQNSWGFIIDTDSYAGNFERELCAHITGQIGECEVGEEYVVEGIENKFPYLLRVADENGVYRPCGLFPTPSVNNNGYGFVFADDQEDQALEKTKEFCRKQAKGFADRVTPSISQTTIDYYNSEFARWMKMADEAVLNKYPAYNSVVLFFEEEPSQEIIELMKERALSFKSLSSFVATPVITGFRSVQYKFTKEVNQL